MPIIKKEPKISGLYSQLVTYRQTTDHVYQKWIDEIKETNFNNRKQWEYIFILQALKENNLLREGQRGVGFGVGSEPLPAVMAKFGCKVLATEINIENKNESGWVKGRNTVSQLEALNNKGICESAQFNELVSFRDVDMNKIPDNLKNFDFTWSSFFKRLDD